MSQENVEIVRRVFDAFDRRDTGPVADLWTTDAEFRPAYIGGGLLERAVFRRPKGLAEFIELQSETWDSIVAEPVEISDVGEGCSWRCISRLWAGRAASRSTE